MIHFNDQRQQILEALQRLEDNTQPLFGIMTPQHMVEHIAQAVSISNGERTLSLMVDSDRASTQKRIMIFTDRPFPKGMKAPSLDGKQPALMFNNLDEAKRELIRQFDLFDAWYHQHPEATCMHPFLGPLNQDEWVRFHTKHVTHHFQQFSLI
jgi:hypothetical protein